MPLRAGIISSFVASRTAVVMCLLIAGIRTDDHYITPTVILSSCHSHTVTLAIGDLQAHGMMYIRTNGVYNIQPTMDGNAQYTCGFDECGVQWDEEFEFVIQRKTTVQTHHDVHLIFRCMADTNPILSDDAANGDLSEGDIAKFVYSATAEMKFYSGDEELESGTFVILGTNIHVLIRITNNFEDFADINVKSCTASTMYMFQDRCPIDYDLMGEFNKTGIGVVENQFPMFRPTSTAAGPLDILFSCVLEVCRAPCPHYACNETSSIHPVTAKRRRRQSSDILKSLIVGTFFSVGLEDEVSAEVVIVKYCVEMHIAAVALGVISFLFLVSMATLMFYYLEMKSFEKQAKSKKCTTEDNITSISEASADGKEDLRFEAETVSVTKQARNSEDNANVDLVGHKDNPDQKIMSTDKNMTSTDIKTVSANPTMKSTEAKNESIDTEINSEKTAENKNNFTSKERTMSNSSLQSSASDGNTDEKIGKPLMKRMKSVHFNLAETGQIQDMADTCFKESNGLTNVCNYKADSENSQPCQLKSALKKQSKGRYDHVLDAVVSIDATVDKVIIKLSDKNISEIVHDEQNNIKTSDGHEPVNTTDTNKSPSPINQKAHIADEKEESEHSGKSKKLQQTLAAEAMAVKASKKDPILQQFRNSLSAVRRRSSLQKTDSMRSLLAQSDNESNN